MCKAHLGAFAVSPRLLECLSAGERSGEVSCMFVDVARDPPLRLFRAALRFEGTRIAIEFARAIEERVAVMYRAARSELLSARAPVDISVVGISDIERAAPKVRY